MLVHCSLDVNLTSFLIHWLISSICGAFQVAFLRYTQQWKKRVMFVLNKADIFRNPNEVILLSQA